MSWLSLLPSGELKSKNIVAGKYFILSGYNIYVIVGGLQSPVQGLSWVFEIDL